MSIIKFLKFTGTWNSPVMDAEAQDTLFLMLVTSAGLVPERSGRPVPQIAQGFPGVGDAGSFGYGTVDLVSHPAGLTVRFTPARGVLIGIRHLNSPRIFL